MIRPWKDDASLNRKGHLFVLIGPETFSAAMSNAAQFRTMTEAVLVGEPIGERPNSYQEPREFTLPNSRLVVRYSTKFYTFAKGPENVVAPDKTVVTTWDDYKTGHDAPLEWVLAQKWAAMLVAVAVGLPSTRMCLGTYMSAKKPGMEKMR